MIGLFLSCATTFSTQFCLSMRALFPNYSSDQPPSLSRSLSLSLSLFQNLASAQKIKRIRYTNHSIACTEPRPVARRGGE